MLVTHQRAGVPQFAVLGEFIGRGSATARVVGPGADGRQRLYVEYVVYPSAIDLVAYDVDSGDYRVWSLPGGNAWAMEFGADGRLYLGAGEGHLWRLCPRTGALDDLGGAVPGEQMIWALSPGPDGLLYGGTHPSAHLFVCDPASGALSDVGRMSERNQYNHDICAAPDGWVYCGLGCERAEIIAYHPATGARRSLLPEALSCPGFARVYRGEDGGAYVSLSGVHLRLCDGRAVEMPAAMPARSRTRLADGREAREPGTYPGNALCIHAVAAGPDGKIYASSILPEYLLQYDPASGVCANLGLIPGAEAYALLPAHDRLFIASYTGTTLQVYDPARPFNPGRQRIPTPPDAERGNNPANYGPLAAHQDRPFDMVMGADGRIYVGCVAGYGYRDGAIAWYDPATDTTGFALNPLKDQGVMALCPLPDGRLACGTSTLCGGVPPTTTEGQLFLWDPRTRAMASAAIVPMPGMPEITNLALGGDGLLYGSAITELFVVDPRTMQVLSCVSSPQSHIRRQGMLTLEDGRVVALAGPMAIFVSYVDGAWRLEEFARFDDGWPWVGKAVLGDYLYAGSGSKLIRCAIPGL